MIGNKWLVKHLPLNSFWSVVEMCLVLLTSFEGRHSFPLECQGIPIFETSLCLSLAWIEMPLKGIFLKKALEYILFGVIFIH